MKSKTIVRNAIALILLAGMILFPDAARGAQDLATPPASPSPETPTLVLQPIDHAENGYFRLELDAGESATLKVLIGNGGKSPIDVRIYAADAYTIQNGGFGLKDSTTEKTGVTTWIDFPTKEMTLGPAEGVETSFTVQVPEGTSPGQYITGVAMETAEPIAAGQSDSMFQFNQVLRSVSAVFITVPGPKQPALEIGDASYVLVGALDTIRVDIHNTGNVLLTPKGQLTVFNTQDVVIFHAPITMGVVYAGDNTQIAIGLAQPLPPGNHSLTIDLSDEVTGVNASRSDLTIAVAPPATPTALEPVRVVSATIEPKPSADQLQFLNVSATIRNDGAPVSNVVVTLHAFKNGELVEDFPIATSVTLATGDTPIQNRYLPLDGWTSGTWTFSLTVEVAATGSGTSQLLTTADISGEVVVP